MTRYNPFPITFPLEDFILEFDGRIGYGKIGSFKFGKVRWPRATASNTEDFLYTVRQVVNNSVTLAYHVAVADTRFQTAEWADEFPQDVDAFIEEDS